MLDSVLSSIKQVVPNERKRRNSLLWSQYLAETGNSLLNYYVRKTNFTFHRLSPWLRLGYSRIVFILCLLNKQISLFFIRGLDSIIKDCHILHYFQIQSNKTYQLYWLLIFFTTKPSKMLIVALLLGILPHLPHCW